MEQIFHSIDIKRILENELLNVSEDLTIVSAFCKLDALKFVNERTVNVKSKKLLVRLRLQDILYGATDFEIVDYCMKNNWKLYFNFDLHSKIYSFDNKVALIGSSNLTLSGLGLKDKANIETITRLSVDNRDNLKIEKLFCKSCEMNEEIYSLMIKQLDNVNKEIKSSDTEWSEDILQKNEFDVDFIWTTEMLFSNSIDNVEEHDKELLELSDGYDKEELLKKFKQSKAYIWLKSVVKDEMYFGELSSKLHNALLDDPKPYRKDVKMLLGNLLNWVIELNLDEIIVDRPNYSQRVRLSCNKT